MRRIGPQLSVMRCPHTRIAWRRWSPPRKVKRRFTGYSRAKRTRCAARCPKRFRTLATDDDAILHVRGRRAGVAATTGYFRVRLGRRECGAHRIWIGGTWPMAYETLPTRAYGLPGPVAPLQAGSLDVRCPDAQNQREGQLPGIHRGC